MTFIAAILYLPHHISVLAGRAWYYIKGEHINGSGIIREAVQTVSKSITTALDEPVPTAVRVKEAIGTIEKEL